MKKYKISFITTCMGRKQHVMKTLPQNILDNKEYPEVEFVLLDYTSKDGLSKWVKSELSDQLETGTVSYFRFSEAEYFHRSHARNMAFRLATGDILCNVDADNYTGKGYADYINHFFQNVKDGFLTFKHNSVRKSQDDFIGRFCCRKSDFEAVNGYDENFENYGYEDIDLYYRLTNNNLKEYHFQDSSFFNAITHADELRSKNESFSNLFQAYYTSYKTPIETDILCLLKNGTFQKGTLVNIDKRYNVRIQGKQWEQGLWTEQAGRLYLENGTLTECLKPSNSKNLVDLSTTPFTTYTLITNQELLKAQLTRHTTITNYEQLLFNKEQKVTKVNSAGFGKGTVIKNFQSKVSLN